MSPIQYSDSNLMALFELIAGNSSTQLVIAENYKAVLTSNFAWPNAVFNLNLTAENQQEILDTLSEQIKAGNLPKQVRTPLQTSPELIQQLEQRAFRQGSWTAMSMSKAHLILSDSDIEIEVLTCSEQIGEWLEILENELMKGGKLEHKLFEKLLAMPGIVFFMAYLNGQPVGTALTYQVGDQVGVYLIATKANCRKKGVGKAITSFAVNMAFKNGSHTAHLQATALGKSVYAAVGFQDMGELRVFMLGEG